MGTIRPFTKLKKQIENLFLPELNMKIYCLSHPIRSQRGNSSIPRFYIKMGTEIVWDFPKDFTIRNFEFQLWKDRVEIPDLIRKYIDSPIAELPEKRFVDDFFGWKEKFDPKSGLPFKMGLTDAFKAADRRIGNEKLRVGYEKDHMMKLGVCPLAITILTMRGIIPDPKLIPRPRMRPNMSFQQRAILAEELLAKQLSVKIEDARMQAICVKARSSAMGKKQVPKEE
jgi:hypothetical protein